MDDRYLLVMKSGDGGERPFAVSSDPVIIGRSARSDIRIALPSVATCHAEARVTPAGLELTKRGGEDVVVNGSPIESTVLDHGDRVCIGPVTFTVRAPRAVPRTDAFPTRLPTDELLPPREASRLPQVEAKPERAPSPERTAGEQRTAASS